MKSTHSIDATSVLDQNIDLDEWISVHFVNIPEKQLPMVKKAADYARQAHGDQKRASGEPYIKHPLEVAAILAGLNLDTSTVCAALLHDVVEDTPVTAEQLGDEFGEEVASLVDGVTKMDFIHDVPSGISMQGHKDKVNAESLRKLLLAMVDDVRVILIKLADRLHNMRTLSFLSEHQQKKIARETLDIYAPLANRLGIWQVKWELEDLSLRYLEPATYKDIARLLDEKRTTRESYIASVLKQIEGELDKAGIKAEVTGRPKHIYSIWKKMKRKDIGFHEIFDVRAVRVIVENLADCYAALGIVHTLWRHIPREFDDYIATPKGNNYQSIHTAVVGPEGKTLEVQIRTSEMHENSELGVAAHWRYKEGTKYDEAFEQKVAWLRQLLEWKDEEDSAGDFIDRFKAEVYEDRVYVITPKGSIVDLAVGSTPLDFAYSIHTDVGHRCRGAKVNGRIVPLTYELQNGEQVEVLTTRNGVPSRDWLNPYLGYLKSSRARAKVRNWFRHQDQGRNMSDGRQLLDKELKRLGQQDYSIDKLADRTGFSSADDFLVAVGRGEISQARIANEIQADTRVSEDLGSYTRQPSSEQPSSEDFSIYGVGNLMSNIARCCKPVPSDEIAGYITKGRGVTIHRKDCPNILRLSEEDKGRLIEVSWGKRTRSSYPVDIQILAYDRQGLLRDITAIITNLDLNVLAITTMTDIKDHLARMSITIEIEDISQLSKVLSRMSQLPNVIEAVRKRG